MFVFARAPDRRTAHASSPLGQYWYEGPDHNKIIVCNCPTCGVDSQMALPVHSIANDGSVSPSYVCPQPGCTFHEAVKLGDWTPPDRRTR